MDSRLLARRLERFNERFGRGRDAALASLLRGLEAAGLGDGWELGVSSFPERSEIAVRYRGAAARPRPWRQALAALFGRTPARACSLSDSPWPRLEIRWDLKAGRWTRGLLYAGAEPSSRRLARFLLAVPGRPAAALLLEPVAWGALDFGDSAARKVLRELAAFAPVRDSVMHWDLAGGQKRPSGCWSLRLQEPLPWPHFLGLDAARAFQERSAGMAAAAGAGTVCELLFEPDRLWAYGAG
ncbi:MAG: hypothetical protein KGO96_03690 [Elusimicrobia bacterium]|nr:hypothetical protein [Elusimicrobiota bacterium]MDE2424995.1 hypothetical protein [Elusimicrobiota bacterium]